MDVQAQALTQTYPWRKAPAAEFAVIAEDASHSLSPAMHDAAFQAVGLNLRYVAVNVPRGEVVQALSRLKELGYTGVNVTVPHKTEALEFLSNFENPDYPEVRAVNTVRMSDKVGFNTDTVGFLRSLRNEALAPGDRCVVLGAGGSALAVLGVLTRLGLEVFLWNRTFSRAEELAERFVGKVRVVSEADVSGCRMVVNTTSAGKQGENLPVVWPAPPSEWFVSEGGGRRVGDLVPGIPASSPPGVPASSLPGDPLAYDLFYAPIATPFLVSAADHGFRTKDGVELLVFQGAEAWKCWGLSQEPPTDIMENAVREGLAPHA